MSAAVISGTVTDEFGDPVVDALVTADPSTGDTITGRTGGDGSYSISVSSGTYDVSVDPVGYLRVVEQDVSVGSSGTVTVDFSLPAGFQTRGRYAGAELRTAGVFGEATAATGVTFGVAGTTVSNAARATGVFGKAIDTTGATFGVKGRTNGAGTAFGSTRFPAAGVKGEADPTSGTGVGVYGRTLSRTTDDAGVEGVAAGATGTVYGVRGETRSGAADAAGVFGTTEGSGGVGIATPDDLRADGAIDTTGAHLVRVDDDRSLRLGSTGTDTTASGVTYTVGGSVVGGYAGNATNGALGATIAGGGGETTFDDSNDLLTAPNEVTDRYGTVGGGAANQAGDGRSGTENAVYATVGGGLNNVAGGARAGLTNGPYATVGGGRNNTATAKDSTVGGGKDNTASADWATIGGGDDNTASGEESTVGGGFKNTASGSRATVGGGGGFGGGNTASGNYSTVGGGRYNTASADWATIGGGDDNTASGEGSTVGGGEFNTASGNNATVGGGDFNTASGSDSTVGGGQDNRTGKSGTSKGRAATVPGGRNNVAQEDDSFAAGRRAKATDEGSFVWADSRDQTFSSNGPDQFVVEAEGGVGIGTNTPFAKLEVENARAGNAGGNPAAHVAIVDNTADETSGVDETNANGLAIKCGPTSSAPPTGVNFISFYNGGGNSYGAIQGNGSGGTELKSTGSDYAEYLPRRDPDAAFAAGDVVGVREGQLVADAAGADRAMVVSDRHIVLGNAPREGEAADHEPVAFTGQVPVRVRGSVAAGDVIVPAGDGDGTARAVDPDEWTPADGPVVGQAWERDESAGTSEVTVAVGIDDPGVVSDRGRIADLRAAADDRDERIDRVAAENDRLRAELERKDERIDALEERLATLEAHVRPDEQGGPAPADD